MKRTSSRIAGFRVDAIIAIAPLLILASVSISNSQSGTYVMETSVLDQSGGSPTSTDARMIATSGGQPTPIGEFHSSNFKLYAGYIYTLESGTDSDGDGVGDDTDNCPRVSNPNQSDSDNDSVGDACDNCPDTSNPNQSDSDGNGKGDACDCQEEMRGDVNGDCAVNVLDVVKLTNCCILEMCPCSEDMRQRGDINGPPGNCDGDGALNVLDAVKIVRLILEFEECP